MMRDNLPLQLEHIRSVHAGSIIYTPGARLGPRSKSREIQFVLVHSGSLEVKLNGGQPLAAGPGSLLMLEPFNTEEFSFHPDLITSHRWIDIKLSHLEQAVADQLNGLPKIVPLPEEMNMLTDFILLSAGKGSRGDDAAMRAAGLAAFYVYLREANVAKQLNQTHQAVLIVENFVHHHYSKPIQLKDLAEQAGLSREHLIRVFKKHTGCTPSQYVWKFRGGKACEMLEYTGLKIHEIAERCGFTSVYHFTRFMKSLYGLSPSKIRNRQWTKD